MAHKLRQTCPTCHLPVPKEPINAMSVPCSSSHIRCLRCAWPVAKTMMDEDEICLLCKLKKKQIEGKSAVHANDEEVDE